MSAQATGGGASVLALAGRRIDAEGAAIPRFPLAAVQDVRRRLRELFVAERAVALVCSAACGADLIALDAAGALGLRRRVVLPFAKAKFRDTSVADRPGDWGALFDAVVAEVEARGDLVVLPACTSNRAAYLATNEAIVREARNLDAPGERAAVVVWEGQPRSGADMTQAFRDLASRAGFSLRSVPTISTAQSEK